MAGLKVINKTGTEWIRSVAMKETTICMTRITTNPLGTTNS
jgi:hypothetical protein